MADIATQILKPAGRMCRTVALALISGFARRTGFHRLETNVSQLPVGQQAVLVTATLAGLLCASLFAAQFGLIGMAVFFGAVVILVG